MGVFGNDPKMCKMMTENSSKLSLTTFNAREKLISLKKFVLEEHKPSVKFSPTIDGIIILFVFIVCGSFLVKK